MKSKLNSLDLRCATVPIEFCDPLNCDNCIFDSSFEGVAVKLDETIKLLEVREDVEIRHTSSNTR